ncbi:hypothetical protein RBSH_00446 [Rhodopirellula baltica SH28]|uniref:Uncharacterized protein n=1 Tax=Rhodopirellula baltica SH28 TaxID=993517 RepID=K5EEH1_RHOBT|nr:hypothetical protein RBSH_00446 [Rhodopirellula baltica SH28]
MRKAGFESQELPDCRGAFPRKTEANTTHQMIDGDAGTCDSERSVSPV